MGFGSSFLFRLFRPRDSFQPWTIQSRSEDEVLKNIVLLLGKLPEPIWFAWDKRMEYFDEIGKPLAKPSGDTRLVWFHSRIMSEEERVIFEKMILTMVVLEPEKRGTITDVMKSEWFVRFCKNESF